MTPPFGMGDRLVWLVDATLTQRCPDAWLAELERSLPVLPATTTLLLTTPSKPDQRLKSTKLLQKHAEIQEFSPIPPWKTEQLVKLVQTAAQELELKLTSDAIQRLAEAIGNDTRQLYNELEKLKVYAGDQKKPLGAEAIAALVSTSTQTSRQLAAAVRQADIDQALTLLADLLNRNEPALRIVFTLVAQVRTWLWIKVMGESGERDERAIARAAEIGNPKQLYYLQKDVQPLSLTSLRQALSVLLELEAGLKDGAEEWSLFSSKIIELCLLFQQPRLDRVKAQKLR
ncbi:MAG: DNA polymerase III subunit delta, partial [Leptolyngbyaceae cyanobacterium SL_7_1]|nr:DNA polymerase III subunit delta [Leptolyngbyaceae cyanobacterium SL_7_1]